MEKTPPSGADLGAPSRAWKTGSPSKRGRQHHTICACLSISALTEQLPMRPRSRFCNVPSSCELRRQSPQPFEELGGSGGPERGVRGARADLDRNAIPGIDQNKGILVGHVIPGEHRAPAREWRLFEEIRDGGPLVAADRLYLDDHLAALDLSLMEFADGVLQGLDACLLEFGVGAIVERQRAVFALHQQTWMLGQQRKHRPLDRGRKSGIEC